MSNRIEQVIGDIEDYIDTCKMQPFSNTKIIVDRPQIEEFLEELRQYTPEEVKKYQRMLNNRDKILNDAKKKAQEIEDKAMAYADMLVSENQITKMAYDKADEIVSEAQDKAKEILDNANADADTIRTGAMSYTNDRLSSLKSILTGTIEDTEARYSALMAALVEHQKIVTENLKELNNEPDDDVFSTASVNPQQFFETPELDEDEDDNEEHEN